MACILSVRISLVIFGWNAIFVSGDARSKNNASHAFRAIRVVSALWFLKFWHSFPGLTKPSILEHTGTPIKMLTHALTLLLFLATAAIIHAQAVSQINDGQIQAPAMTRKEALQAIAPSPSIPSTKLGEETGTAESPASTPSLSPPPNYANISTLLHTAPISAAIMSAPSHHGVSGYGGKGNGTAPTVPVLTAPHTSATPSAVVAAGTAGAGVEGTPGGPGESVAAATATTSAVAASGNYGVRVKIDVAMVELAGIVGLAALVG